MYRKSVIPCNEVAGLSFDDKSNWLKRNPVTAARHFQYKLNALFQGFLQSTAKPLGEIADYAIRIEFQARGLCDMGKRCSKAYQVP